MIKPNYKLLAIDDNHQFLNSLSRAFNWDYNIWAASNLEEAKYYFAKEPDIVLLDLRLDENDPNNIEGVHLLKEFHSINPSIPIIMISAFGDINMAVECMQLGAVDFIQKPAKLNELHQRINSSIERSKISRKASQLEERLQTLEPDLLIGNSTLIKSVKDMVTMVAKDGYATVLITGETGTGKELVARSIHQNGWRSSAPFVTVAISSLNPSIMESELFGYEAGAFTGANKRKFGFFEKAKGGVLFLDEIGELTIEAQTKLLRFLEGRNFCRVGGTEDIEVDIQIITATNRNLDEAIKNKLIRNDLYFRLNNIHIQLPLLRERLCDIPDLIIYFLGLFRDQGRTKIKTISGEALKYLQQYPWPGNVRELKSVLERAIILANFNKHEIIEKDDLSLEIYKPNPQNQDLLISKLINRNITTIEKQLAIFELNIIEEALKNNKGNKSETWKTLGLNDRFALYRRVKTIEKKHPELIINFPYLKDLYD